MYSKRSSLLKDENGFCSTESGKPNIPISWSKAAYINSLKSFGFRFNCVATRRAKSVTRREWPAILSARISIMLANRRTEVMKFFFIFSFASSRKFMVCCTSSVRCFTRCSRLLLRSFNSSFCRWFNSSRRRFSRSKLSRSNASRTSTIISVSSQGLEM